MPLDADARSALVEVCTHRLCASESACASKTLRMNSAARACIRPASQFVLLLRSGACRRAHTRAATEQVKHAFAVERVLVEIKVGTRVT